MTGCKSKILKFQAVKCITDNDVVQGVGDFLTRFACLMNNIVLDSVTYLFSLQTVFIIENLSGVMS